jgi:hypothetical protein
VYSRALTLISPCTLRCARPFAKVVTYRFRCFLICRAPGVACTAGLFVGSEVNAQRPSGRSARPRARAPACGSVGTHALGAAFNVAAARSRRAFSVIALAHRHGPLNQSHVRRIRLPAIESGLAPTRQSSPLSATVCSQCSHVRQLRPLSPVSPPLFGGFSMCPRTRTDAALHLHGTNRRSLPLG